MEIFRSVLEVPLKCESVDCYIRYIAGDLWNILEIKDDITGESIIYTVYTHQYTAAAARELLP